MKINVLTLNKHFKGISLFNEVTVSTVETERESGEVTSTENKGVPDADRSYIEVTCKNMCQQVAITQWEIKFYVVLNGSFGRSLVV